MNMPNLPKMMGSIQPAMRKHSSEILTSVGIAGMVTTTIMAVRATPKAINLIDNATVEKSLNLGQGSESVAGRLTPTEVVKTTWKCYIPAAITGSLSILCLVGASSVNARRNAALATAYTISETALKDYQEKVIETIGEKKERDVRDAVAKDKITRDPVKNHEVIITEKGNTLCYDAISGRYFKSDMETIKRAENELNRQMLDEMYVSLNEFYDKLGLENVKMGDDLGWYVNDGYLELGFSSHLTNNDVPCLVIDYIVGPRFDYRDR
jgi:hypothetical protein